jgi:hypothetical protein
MRRGFWLSGGLSFNSCVGLFVYAGFSGFAWAGGGCFGDAFVGDALGGGAFAGCGSGEGAVEAVDVYGAFADFAFNGGVHGGEKLGAELVENFVYVDVGHRCIGPLILWPPRVDRAC